jgi:hypothetical protein
MQELAQQTTLTAGTILSPQAGAHHLVSGDLSD